ncbi:BON domain-containing protein [Duganella sp. SAP-35]|uniref:BON domain-containing protein n=2 Tax=Duganella aceris TaxID=2703883 RepID=A0ABX0FNZ5_9BURK|nr:BON domain-containing protein [Duganella aceris]
MALAGGSALAQTTPVAPAGQVTPSADNTRMNNRDQGSTGDTAQSQSNAKGDRELLAAVRRTVVKDKSLSISAHNVKILAANGVVTLRGPVTSEEEKTKVEALAKQVAGVTSVQNNLDIKTN